jgi:hypothetical protein
MRVLVLGAWATCGLSGGWTRLDKVVQAGTIYAIIINDEVVPRKPK